VPAGLPVFFVATKSTPISRFLRFGFHNFHDFMIHLASGNSGTGKLNCSERGGGILAMN
jgi:hypothetical protein